MRRRWVAPRTPNEDNIPFALMGNSAQSWMDDGVVPRELYLMQTQHDHSTLTNAARLREHAVEVLRRLIDEREQFKRRLEESGKRDPMTVITGHSAVDAAIARTRSMISDMDSLLRQMNADLSALDSSRLAEPVGAAATV